MEVLYRRIIEHLERWRSVFWRNVSERVRLSTQDPRYLSIRERMTSYVPL
ncbi:MAG: hypothetical protein DDT28_01054 [Dehalococcoidia bacterium]|nr:hypothetical protein [Chloroflexota bacterium]